MFRPLFYFSFSFRSWIYPCLEHPALFKIRQADSGGALLMHVDDVLFSLKEEYLLQKFMPAIRETFKAAMAYGPRT